MYFRLLQQERIRLGEVKPGTPNQIRPHAFPNKMYAAPMIYVCSKGKPDWQGVHRTKPMMQIPSPLFQENL